VVCGPYFKIIVDIPWFVDGVIDVDWCELRRLKQHDFMIVGDIDSAEVIGWIDGLFIRV
jgi:hypothetical protein